MTDRLRARVLVTVLLILLTVAGIRAIGPAGDWSRPTGSVLIVGVLVEVLLAGMYIALRWRHRPPARELAGKLHQIVSAALVTSFLGVLLGLILYEYDFKPGQAGHIAERVRLPRRPVTPQRKSPKLPQSHPLPIRDLLIALLIIVIIAVLIAIWYRSRVVRLRLDAPDDLGVDEADELARVVESGRAALRDIDDARAAIIACYVAMEQSLAEAGTARGAAETPDELLVRAVAADLVPRGPATLLTGLFYEARYSTHHMPIGKRDQAEQALADIAAGLPAGEFA